MKLDKNEETKIWETMLDKRRRLGPDPDDHPSVRRRMEIEYESIRIIINSILAKLSTTKQNTCSPTSQPGWWNKSATLIIMILLMATLTMATLVYREMSALNSRATGIMNDWQTVGRTLLSNPKITCEFVKDDMILTYWQPKDGIDVPVTLKIPHELKPEQLERLKKK